MTRVYDLRVLFSRELDPNTKRFDLDSREVVPLIVDLLKKGFDPNSWDTAGGTATIEQSEWQLKITQTEFIHSEISELFRLLTEAKAVTITASIDFLLVAPDQEQAMMRRASNAGLSLPQPGKPKVLDSNQGERFLKYADALGGEQHTICRLDLRNLGNLEVPRRCLPRSLADHSPDDRSIPELRVELIVAADSRNTADRRDILTTVEISCSVPVTDLRPKLEDFCDSLSIPPGGLGLFAIPPARLRPVPTWTSTGQSSPKPDGMLYLLVRARILPPTSSDEDPSPRTQE